MKYTSRQISDAFEWDAVNWSYCLEHWKPYMAADKPLRVLTVGEKNAGISLLFALAGNEVTATDLEGVTDRGKELHKRHNVSHLVTYNTADLTSLPFPDGCFDIVACKSVLVMLRSVENQKKALQNIHRVLKPGGYLLFAENLKSTPFHNFLRNKFQPWAHYTLYMDYAEKDNFFSIFSERKFSTRGFLGNLIPNQQVRILLGKIDTLINPVIPDPLKYILFGACKK